MVASLNLSRLVILAGLFLFLIPQNAVAQVVGGGTSSVERDRLYVPVRVSSELIRRAYRPGAAKMNPILRALTSSDSTTMWLEKPIPKFWRPRKQAPPYDQQQLTQDKETVRIPRSLTLLSDFDAIDYDTDGLTNGAFHIPADPDAAAGPDHVVIVVNTSIQWYSTGGILQDTQSLETFFAAVSPVNDTFDPRVIYDQIADRFVVLTLESRDVGDGDAVNSSRILIAVSDTSDPNGAWTFQAINAVTSISSVDNWADYPGLAIDEEAIFITANMFTFSPSTYSATRLWIVDKGTGSGGIYAGGTSTVTAHDPFNETGTANLASTLQPAHVFAPVPSGNIGTYLFEYSALSSGGSEFVHIIRVDSPLGTPSFESSLVAVGDIDDTNSTMPNAEQSGTGTGIVTNDRRSLKAVWRNDTVYGTTTVNPASGTDSGQSTVFWINLDVSTPGFPDVSDSGTIGGEEIASGTHTFYPSIAVNSSGDVAVGFSASAATIFPGAFVTGRRSMDPAGVMDAPTTLRAGVDYYVRTFGSVNRWGDYSGMSVDPDDDSTFWVFNEYAMARGSVSAGEDGRWGTAVGHFSMDGSVGVPGAVTLSSPGDDGVDISVTPTLSWGALDGVTSYDVQLSTVNDFASTIFENLATTNTSVTPGTLSNNTRYFWRVRASNANGDGPWSSRNFTTVELTVPTTVADAYSVDEGDQLAISAGNGVLSNDSDPEGQTLTAALATTVTNGSLTLALDGSFTYTHDGSETTTDSFSYTATDGATTSEVTHVSLTINPVNDTPVADDKNVTTPEDVAVAVTLTGTDAEESSLSFAVASQPASGTVFINGDQAVYTPTPSFGGTDSFTYIANDGTADSAPATVTILVSSVNDAPVARDVVETTIEDESVDVTLLGSDVDLDPLTFRMVAEPSDGSVSITEATATFVPNPDFNGQDSFMYVANDGTVDSNVATVTITVTPVNDPPTEPVVILPVPGSEVTVSGQPEDRIGFSWSGSTDPEGEQVSYVWTLASSTDVLSVLWTVSTDETSVDTTVTAVARLLDGLGVVPGGKRKLYQRVIASDGALETSSDVASINFVRGAVVGIQDDLTLPASLELNAIYPNPASRTVNLRYGLARPQTVEISIFDVLGRVVLRESAGRRVAGYHDLQLNVGGLTSGVYYIRLEADDGVIMKRLVVTRS